MNTRIGHGNATDFECHTEELVPISVTNKIDTTKTNTSNHLSAFVEEDANPANSPDYSPEITPPLDFSSPLSTPRDWLSPRPLVPPNTTESPNIRHTLSDSRLDDAASPRQSDTFVEARTNDSYALSYPVTPKVPAWIPSISSATPTSIPHPLISVQEDFSPKKEKVTRKIDRIRRDIPRFVHVSSSRDLSSTIPEPHYVSSSPPCDPATPKAPVWPPSNPHPLSSYPKDSSPQRVFPRINIIRPDNPRLVNVSPLRRNPSPRIPELHYLSSSSQPPAIAKQTVASFSNLRQEEDKPEVMRKPNDDPVFPGAYPIDELEQSGYSQLPFVSKLCSLSSHGLWN
jgi:hypothetical protein